MNLPKAILICEYLAGLEGGGGGAKAGITCSTILLTSSLLTLVIVIIGFVLVPLLYAPFLFIYFLQLFVHSRVHEHL